MRLGALDAPRLVASAARHGVSAWLADLLAERKLALPSAAQAALLADARALISRGLRIRRLTLEVLDAFAAQQVVPVLLKGAGLAERLFPEQPLARPSTDVDVLVRVDQLPAAKRALEARGLREGHDDSLGDVFDEHHHLSFARPDALVEVHFRLFSGFGGHHFDDAHLRSRLQRGDFHGRPVSWLHPEDEFVYLATHAANHGFLRASWLLDLQRYVSQSNGFDWAEMARACDEAGFSSAVGATLFILHDALGVTLPDAARAAFSQPLWRAAGHRRLFSPAHLESADFAAHRVAGFGLRLWLVDSPRDGLRHAAQGALRWWRAWRAT